LSSSQSGALNQGPAEGLQQGYWNQCMNWGLWGFGYAC